MQSDSTPDLAGSVFIDIGNGSVTLVDADVAEFLKGREFRLTHGYVAVLTSSGWVRLHRVIMRPSRGLCVDHINGVKLDNRRVNLRVVTSAENSVNARKRKGVTLSRFKGVSLDRSSGLWRARITINGKLVSIGSFAQETRAAEAYDCVAFEAWGERACLNFGNPITGSIATSLLRDRAPAIRACQFVR